MAAMNSTTTVAIIDAILSAGADVNYIDMSGYHVFSYLGFKGKARKDYFMIVRWVLQAGFDLTLLSRIEFKSMENEIKFAFECESVTVVKIMKNRSKINRKLRSVTNGVFLEIIKYLK